MSLYDIQRNKKYKATGEFKITIITMSFMFAFFYLFYCSVDAIAEREGLEKTELHLLIDMYIPNFMDLIDE